MRKIDKDFIEYVSNCGDHSEGSKSIRADAFYAAYNVMIKNLSDTQRLHEQEISALRFQHEKMIHKLLEEFNK